MKKPVRNALGRSNDANSAIRLSASGAARISTTTSVKLGDLLTGRDARGLQTFPDIAEWSALPMSAGPVQWQTLPLYRSTSVPSLKSAIPK